MGTGDWRPGLFSVGTRNPRNPQCRPTAAPMFVTFAIFRAIRGPDRAGSAPHQTSQCHADRREVSRWWSSVVVVRLPHRISDISYAVAMQTGHFTRWKPDLPAALWYFFSLFTNKLHNVQLVCEQAWNLPPGRRRHCLSDQEPRNSWQCAICAISPLLSGRIAAYCSLMAWTRPTTRSAATIAGLPAQAE